jgi:Protein of unknown function (DUF3131)
MPQLINKIILPWLKLVIVALPLLSTSLISNSYAETAATTQPGVAKPNSVNRAKQPRANVQKKKVNKKVKQTTDSLPNETQTNDSNEPEILNLTVKSKGAKKSGSTHNSSLVEDASIDSTQNSCTLNDYPENSCIKTYGKLCDEDLEIAKIAWKYFENNYQPKTGLVNAANKYPSTTMWDSGSALAATIAAREFDFITQKQFDDRIMALLTTLNTMKLFNGEAPNKAYNSTNGEMVDYGNKPSAEGIGVSALDLARMTQWLNVLSCKHPKHQMLAQKAIARWKYCRLIKDGQLYGLDKKPGKEPQVLQEGRLGYEQYAGKIFSRLGFDQKISKTYKNEFTTETEIYGVPIVYDSRDPKQLGAYNYVVTESYVMDAMENGIDTENASLIDNIYKVQQKRWENTGQITAVTEDNVDRDPWFVYNTIFVAGKAWNAITDTGKDMDKLRSVSTKAAMSMALLKPNELYSKVLMNHVRSAYDPEAGWYSGVYENGFGYNKAITANTNGVILESLLYKIHGPLAIGCAKCNKGFDFNDQFLKDANATNSCIPAKSSVPDCAKLGTCSAVTKE